MRWKAERKQYRVHIGLKFGFTGSRSWFLSRLVLVLGVLVSSYLCWIYMRLQQVKQFSQASAVV